MNWWRWNIRLWSQNPIGDRVPNTKPVWMPEYYWRRVKIVRDYYFLLAVPMIIGVLLCVLDRRFSRYILLVFVFQFAATALYAFWPRRIRRQVTEELVANDYLICMTCGYPLGGLSDRYICPECGSSFVPDDVSANWRFWVEHRRLPKRS